MESSGLGKDVGKAFDASWEVGIISNGVLSGMVLVTQW